MEKWYLGLLKKDACFSEQFLAIRNNASKAFMCGFLCEHAFISLG